MTATVAKTSAASGDAQTGTVGQPLATPIRVVVMEGGEPSPDVPVTWSTTVAGGALAPPSGPTDADGVASATWTLGTVAGAQTARATVTGASGSPVTFDATAAAGAAATLAKEGGDDQTGEVGTQLAAPVQAKVTDQFGNAVAGTDVGWSATGASVSAPTVASDAAGVSQVSVTLGPTEGQITITAVSDGLAGSPLTFTADAVVLPPPPMNIGITVGNDFFRSNRNSSANPAVDTVAVGGTVTWTWVNTGIVAHDVTSNPPPGFSSSTTKAAPASHQVTFNTAGTYRYYCLQHASAASTVGMVGRIVVR
jgi:plastocyanin